MRLRLGARIAKLFPERYLWAVLLLACLLLYGIAVVLHWVAERESGWPMALVSASGVFCGRIGLEEAYSWWIVPLLFLCIAVPIISVFALLDLYFFALRRQAQMAYRGILTHIMVPLSLVVMVLFMSYQGCRQWFYPDQEALSWNQRLDTAYKTLQLIPLQTDLDRQDGADAEAGTVSADLPVLLNAMRFLAPLVTIAAIILAFWHRLKALAEDVRTRMRYGHVVLCGVGEKGYELARQLADRGEQVNVIEVEENNENIDSLRALDVSVVRGNAEDPGVLERAGLLQARHLVLVAGADSTNIDILMAAASLMRRRRGSSGPGANRMRRTGKGRIRVVLHMGDPEVCPLLRDERALNSIRTWFDICVVNLPEMTARDVFVHRVVHVMPVQVGCTQLMHFVIVGFDRVGQAVTLQAAKMVHLAGRNNYCSKEGCLYAPPDRWDALLIPNKLRVTVVDRDQDALSRFREGNPAIEGLCTLTHSGLSGDIAKPSVQDEVANIIREAARPDGSEGAEYVPVVFFCMGNDYLNLTTALRVAKELGADGRADELTRIPFYVELSDSSGLSQLLDEETSDTAWARQLWGFGTIDEVFSPDMVLEGRLDRVARRIHENYRKDCPGEPAWEALPFLLKDSNRQAADHAYVKLRTLGYTAVEITSRQVAKTVKRLRAVGESPSSPGHPEAIAALREVEHARWCAEKNLAGYRYGYGPWQMPFNRSPQEVKAKKRENHARKNEEKRLHIDLAVWECLDDAEKQKDIRQIETLTEAFLAAGLLPMDSVWAQAHARCRVKGGKETIEYAALRRLLRKSEEGMPADAELAQSLNRLGERCLRCEYECPQAPAPTSVFKSAGADGSAT